MVGGVCKAKVAGRLVGGYAMAAVISFARMRGFGST
jgi:hypothetical protein